jgi:hypothetical protein
MTWWSVAPYAAVALLASLLILLGSRAGGLAGERDSPAFRLVLWCLAGAVGFQVILLALQAARISWHPPILLGALGVAIGIGHRYLHGTPTRAPAAAAHRWGPGDAVAGLALGAYAWFAFSLCITLPDFVFHWGVEGERFALSRGIDFAFLQMPWNVVSLHPDYPTLLPSLYAAAALLAGHYDTRSMMAWSVGCFALLLLAAREALRQAGVERLAAQAALALLALTVAAAGMQGRMAGGADWMVALATVAALPALLRPADRLGSWQMGVAGAFAAAAKLEGITLAGVFILVQAVRLAAGTRRGRPFDGRALAGLLAPVAAVTLPWQAAVHHYHLSDPMLGGIHFQNGRAIWTALRYELAASPAWHGFAWSLLVLPLLALWQSLRPIVAVTALQLLCFLCIYFSFLSDPTPLIVESFDRLELDLLPAILLASAIALDSLGKPKPSVEARSPDLFVSS